MLSGDQKRGVENVTKDIAKAFPFLNPTGVENAVSSSIEGFNSNHMPRNSLLCSDAAIEYGVVNGREFVRVVVTHCETCETKYFGFHK